MYALGHGQVEVPSCYRDVCLDNLQCICRCVVVFTAAVVYK